MLENNIKEIYIL